MAQRLTPRIHEGRALVNTLLHTQLLGALLGAVLPIQTQAQEVSDPALLEAFEEIAAMGSNLNPRVVQRTSELFLELHRHTERHGVIPYRDLSYGDDPRHRLDIYIPDAATTLRPAVVFIHPGGLTQGDKDFDDAGLMYANIATWFARHGMVGVNATYRLVPDITYPEGGEDMKAIVDFLQEDGKEFGIDPDGIFFLCASAGCAHTASLLFDRSLMDDGDPDIAGAIMLSGSYGGYNSDYYGADPVARAASSPLGLAESYDGEPVPVFLMSAEYDPNSIETDTARLLWLLCEKRDTCPRYTQARDHNHVSLNQHINTADTRYASQMLDFVYQVWRR